MRLSVLLPIFLVVFQKNRGEESREERREERIRTESTILSNCVSEREINITIEIVTEVKI